MLRAFLSHPLPSSPLSNSIFTRFSSSSTLKHSGCVVSEYQLNVQFSFQYGGKFPSSKIDLQWKEQIKTDKYSNIHFDEHLVSSSVSTLFLGEPYLKGGDYWKLATQNYSIKLPISLRLSKDNEKQVFEISKCTVDYFSNRIGIAEIQITGPKKEKETLPNDTTITHTPMNIQSLLDIQRMILDDKEVRIIESKSENQQKEKKTKKLSIQTKLSDLFHSLISNDVDQNGYILYWSRIKHMDPFFLYSQILIEPPHETDNQLPSPLVSHDSSCFLGWDHYQLASWTYVITSCSVSDGIDVKDAFLDHFIKENCYLRWASDHGGLWLGFTPHSTSAIHFAASKEDAEKVEKQRKLYHPALLAQLVNPVLYQKGYLQKETNRVRGLIEKAAVTTSYRDHSHLSSALKMIEGNLLRFNVNFCDDISDTAAAKSIFEIWQQKLSIEKLKNNLQTHVHELSSFYTNITAEAQQSKLDLLTVIIGCLGVSQLIIGILECENSILASGVSSVSIGTALAAYVQVLHRHESSNPMIGSSIYKSKRSVKKLVREGDIYPRQLSEQVISTFKIRFLSSLLISIGLATIFYDMQNQKESVVECTPTTKEASE